MRWEYQLMKVPVGKFLGPDVKLEAIQQRLDELGDAGWELVSVEDTTMDRGVTDELLFVFKRPRGGEEA